MKQTSQSTVQSQDIWTVQGKKKFKSPSTLITHRPQCPALSYLHYSVCSRLHVHVGLNWEFAKKRKKTTPQTKKQNSILKLQDYGGEGSKHLLKVKMQFPAVYLRKEKNPVPPNLILNMGQVLILCWKPLKAPSCVTQVSRAWAVSYCIICMASQPQVLSAPSRSSAGSLKMPFKSPKRNTTPPQVCLRLSHKLCVFRQTLLWSMWLHI